MRCFVDTQDFTKEEILDLKDLGIDMEKDELINLCEKATEKQFSGLNTKEVIKVICKKIKYIPISLIQRISYEMGILGHTDYKDENIDDNIYVVGNIETNKYGNRFITLYSPKYGEYYQRKVNKYSYNDNPCDSGDIIKTVFNTKSKIKQVDGEWVRGEGF